ncbi:ABC-2 type transport system ATP-binding protein [Kibdelosporangium banguiense]|uniref:ABC-2 type transport system ATP-binding protein n=1 Tax=Kibdelosporangium banguiense TaxID=1365924 RepID=A0ABS4TZA7_9PSEU|nr:ABC transporter ATP-binding protein [Kibdelosporangium banguiense]MBP2329746.1 ABC-2 type transport system ATP-binding protein [Kibdelosporangium banguiense]
MNLLDVQNVSYSYDGVINVLADVSFSVEEEAIVGLVGPNGSGKSTLIKNIFDLLRFQSGSLRVGGYEHASVEAKSLGMYLSSNDYLPEFLTAREYISLLGSLFCVDVDHSQARDLFRRFSMDGRYDDVIEDYSHGMRKKTQLVSALVMRRPLTVIDETLNGIDLEALHLSEKEFRCLRDEGRSILLCTHDFAILERLADRIVFLDLGQVVRDAPTQDLIAEHGSVTAMVFDYLGSEDR